MNTKGMDKLDWFRMNKLKSSVSDIEWTYSNGGIVRARLDSMAEWSYKVCHKAKYAESLGMRLIFKQKKWRQQSRHAKYVDPRGDNLLPYNPI